jgi:hypothetical protein
MRICRHSSIPVPSTPTLAAGICCVGFDKHGLMKLLPALRPIVGDLAGRDLDQGATRGSTHIRQQRQLAWSTVDGVFDHPFSPVASLELDLLDATGRKLEQVGEYELGVAAPHA